MLGSSTNVSKNQLVCARCHFTGLASGIDCAVQSSGDKGAASCSVALRTARYASNMARGSKRAGAGAGRPGTVWDGIEFLRTACGPGCERARWKTLADENTAVNGVHGTARFTVNEL